MRDLPTDSQRRAQQRPNLTPHDDPVPFRNLREVLALHAKTSPHKPFLVTFDDHGQRQELGFMEFTARVHQVANLLYDDLGLRRGDRVAVVGHNCQEVVLIYFACWVIGATVAPQNVGEDDPRIAFILRNSGAKLAFVLGEYLERVRHIVYSEAEGLGAPNILGIIQVGGTPDERHPQFDEIVRQRPTTFLGDDSGAKSGDMSIAADNPNTAKLSDEALLVYTSGTTGAPKGVVLSQFNLLVDAAGIARAQALTGNQKTLCVLPIHHVNGIVATLITPLLVGATAVIERKFSASTFWKRLVEEKISLVSVVPTLLQFLLDHADALQANGQTLYGHGINRLNLANFRHFICGAGTLAVQLAERFEQRFGFRIVHGYGLSETTCFSCFLPITLSWEEHRHWMSAHGYPSIGCPIEPNDMAIFSSDGSGQALGAGERGEICIRGSNVMQGYYQRPEANAEAFAFGWFRTGDEGFYIEDERGRHFFFITGRIKELINRGGVKYSPFEIEEALLKLDGVKVALAVGFENDYFGEEIGAYVVLQDGAQLSAEQVMAHAQALMPFAKCPKVVVFGTEIPVTATGKYQRLRLRELFSAHKGTQFRK